VRREADHEYRSCWDFEGDDRNEFEFNIPTEKEENHENFIFK